jgi:hypothetical protein
MIRPFIVDEGSKRGAAIIAIFFAGAFVSSATVGSLLGFGGEAVIPQDRQVVLLVVATAGIVLATADLRRMTPTTLLQTKKTWWHRGPERAALMWGLHLGAGFATIRVASVYWVVALAIFASGSPLVGVLMGAYGAGLALNLATGVVTARHDDDVHYPLRALRFRRRSTVLLAALLMLWSVYLGVETLA